VDLTDPLVRCLTTGCFVYFDGSFQIVTAHAVYVDKRPYSTSLYQLGCFAVMSFERKREEERGRERKREGDRSHHHSY